MQHFHPIRNIAPYSVVSVEERRRFARHAVARGLSIRKACKIFCISRTAYYYKKLNHSTNPADKRLYELLKMFPEYGYWKLYALLRDEGFVINHKKVYRLHKLWKNNMYSLDKKKATLS